MPRKDLTFLADERLNEAIKFGNQGRTKKVDIGLVKSKDSKNLVDQGFQSDSLAQKINGRVQIPKNSKRTLLEAPLDQSAQKKKRQPHISGYHNDLYSHVEELEPSTSHSELFQTPGKLQSYAKSRINIRTPEEAGKRRVVIEGELPDLINHDLIQHEDKERGWEIESDDPAKIPSNPEAEKDASLEKAKKIIHEIDQPWKMVFDEAAGSIKADFRKIAAHIDHLLANDATLAENMGKQLELSLVSCVASRNKVIEDSGEVLEALVQIQNSNDEISIKIRELERESEICKKDFLQELSEYEAKHVEEIEKMRGEIDAETEEFESLISTAMCDKNEKKDMQKRLAVLLADET
ncbi:uncharacterized protein MELLADRAFT_106288 [Melampsora larici-populina 98AG31]|uniref:Uncharacterized protein n=1 Tax=Melampsora larici-populina (strain 98AG31 / pathotype 3-4-7) TaxID=747676 RepID=F4RKW3_MELLP|nr:uncharacterized protein MELLADRAFT_106288 [Melampsora larici-populina 98AG31]EGG06967.1 hypothetical protein MELLADRAFT_106288 [Melampsora larici-populina 98AG31]